MGARRESRQASWTVWEAATCPEPQTLQSWLWAFPRVSSPPATLGDKLWWADQVSEKMGTCNKADGSGSVVLRNSTTLVMHMKVYDESIQLGRQWSEGHGVQGVEATGMEIGGFRAVTGSSLPRWWVMGVAQMEVGRLCSPSLQRDSFSSSHKGPIGARSSLITRSKGLGGQKT